MLFNSVDFLLFFTVVFFLFYFANGFLRKLILFVSSCIFYMWFVPEYVLILFLTILIDYYAAIRIEDSRDNRHRKLHLLLGIVNTCLVLFVFKYHNFVIGNINLLFGSGIPRWDIVLPIGLSFHVFQSLSYVVDVYRGQIKAERNILVYGNFVMMFPQLVAGPIERAGNMLPQLKACDHKITYNDFITGFTRVLWGLFKKAVVADTVSNLVDAAYHNYGYHDGSTLAAATVLFAVQIYCDFSGYSDMAIGIARMLGFRFRENFRLPYFSKDVTEFWRRWHISLSSWLRDYLYISFGGNRKGRLKQYRNLMLTMLIGGLWHGASWNFVIWGGLNGLYLSLEKMTNISGHRPRLWIGKLFRAAYVFILICVSWIFFRATTIEQGWTILRKIFTDFHPRKFLVIETTLMTSGVFSIIVLLGFEYFLFRKKSFEALCAGRKGTIRAFGFSLLMMILLVLFGNVNGTQFIYFQF